MHGYSMIRPALNQQYFHDLYDWSAAFNVEIEGHQSAFSPLCHMTRTD